jgi:hypothetical protein
MFNHTLPAPFELFSPRNDGNRTNCEGWEQSICEQDQQISSSFFKVLHPRGLEFFIQVNFLTLPPSVKQKAKAGSSLQDWNVQ